jgi:DNA-binding transcriptional regulator YiaG
MKAKLHRFDDAGLRNVWLVNGYRIVDTPYGPGVSYSDLEGLTRVICVALARKPGRLTGTEFRYLRFDLRLSQKSLSELLGNSEQSVANWEKRGRVPLWADKHLRLLWLSANDGQQPLADVIARLNAVERLVNQRIVGEATRRGWRSRVEPAIP